MKNMNQEDLQVFLDMFKDDPKLAEQALRESRQKALSETLGKSAMSASESFLDDPKFIEKGIEPGKELAPIKKTPSININKAVTPEVIDLPDSSVRKLSTELVPSSTAKTVSKLAKLGKAAPVVGAALAAYDAVEPTDTANPADFEKKDLGYGWYQQGPEIKKEYFELNPPKMTPSQWGKPVVEQTDLAQQEAPELLQKVNPVKSLLQTVKPTQVETVQKQPESSISPVKRFELKDDELAEAQDDARRMAGIGQLLAGLNRISAGAAQANLGREIKADTTGIEEASKLPQQLVKDIIQRREQARKLAEDQLTEDSMNPDSNLSQMAMQAVKRVYPNINVDGMSYAQLQKAGFNLGNLAEQEMNAKIRAQELSMRQVEATQNRMLRQEQLTGLQQQREINNIKAVQEAYNKDKDIAKSIDVENSADTVETLLNMKNPIADAGQVALSARIMGHVGVLTEQDVKAFKGSQAIKEQTEQFINDLQKGTLTDTNRRYMKELLQVMKKRSNERLNQRALTLAEQASVRLNVPVETTFNYIRPGQPVPGKQSETDKRIDAFMKANNISDKNEAIKILKEAGKL